MKVIRYHDGHQGSDEYLQCLTDELSKVVPKTYMDNSRFFKKRYNWQCWFDNWGILQVYLHKKQYEDEFVRICREYEVDELVITGCND